MIDLHSHILPGVDDGASTLADSLEIARAAAADGIEVLAATPHVRDDFPTQAGTMERLVGALRHVLARERVPLDVRKGGEIALDWLVRLSLDDLRRFGLAGNPEYLLVEFPYYGWPLGLNEQVFRLRAARITPVIAHPERNAEVQFTPERLRPLVEAGALVQVTAASIDGRLGRAPEATALELVERGLAHLIGSDAHHASVREGGIAAAASAVGEASVAHWLVDEMPRAIVTGSALPAPPAPKRRRWFGRARRSAG